MTVGQMAGGFYFEGGVIPAHVIQFAQLEELVAEPLPNIVRVAALDVTESTSSQIPGLRLAAIGVHVRTINDAGHILAYYASTLLSTSLPVASVQVYEAGPRDSDPAREQYEAAWDRAEALKARVVTALPAKAGSFSEYA